MRELYRFAAKARMNELGYSKPNRCMKRNHWRELTGAWPIYIRTGELMNGSYRGPKKQRRGNTQHFFSYTLKTLSV